jgi:hypothetical protein
MRRTLNIAAAVGLALGLLWILQGASIVGGSVMSGQSVWLYIGIALVVVAAGLLAWANRPP